MKLKKKKGFTEKKSESATRFQDEKDRREARDLIPPESLPVALFRSKDDIVSLGKANIEALIALWRNEEEANVLDQIKSLRVLQRGVGARPLLPEFRRDDYFSRGDKVVMFFDHRGHDGVFCRSEIVNIFCEAKKVNLLHEKMLTVDAESADTRIIGKSAIVGFYRPEVLTKTDFEYLLRHPTYAQMWIRLASRDTSKKNSQFTAMAKEATRRGYPGTWRWNIE